MPTAFLDFQEVKTLASIVDVCIKMLDLPLVAIPSGKLKCKCPLCGAEKGFLVTPDAGTDKLGMWGCFVCQKRGDSIAIVQQLKGMKTMPEAAQAIKAFFGKGTVQSTVNSTVSTVSKKDANSGFDFEDYFRKLDLDHEALAPLGVSRETLVLFKAGYSKAGQNVGRLALTVHDREGNIVVFCGRSLKENENPVLKFPKEFDASHLIFNAHRVGKGELYLVSDPLKVLAAYEAGIENCVSFLTENISAMQLQMLASLMDTAGCTSLEMY